MEHESTIGLPNRKAAILGATLHKTRGVKALFTARREVAHEIPRPTMEDKAPIAPSGDAGVEVVRVDDCILPKHHFLRELQREQRRTDRSTSPLSVAVFRFNGKQGDELEGAENLLKILRRKQAGNRHTRRLGRSGHRDDASRYEPAGIAAVRRTR